MLFNFIDRNRRTASTDIEQYGNLIIATELKENGGQSVTNAAEYIATQYAGQHGIPFDALTFVERYDHRSYEGGKKPLEGEFPNYSFVSFSIVEQNGQRHFTAPKWKHMTLDELNALIEKESA